MEAYTDTPSELNLAGVGALRLRAQHSARTSPNGSEMELPQRQLAETAPSDWSKTDTEKAVLLSQTRLSCGRFPRFVKRIELVGASNMNAPTPITMHSPRQTAPRVQFMQPRSSLESLPMSGSRSNMSLHSSDSASFRVTPSAAREHLPADSFGAPSWQGHLNMPRHPFYNLPVDAPNAPNGLRPSSSSLRLNDQQSMRSKSSLEMPGALRSPNTSLLGLYTPHLESRETALNLPPTPSGQGSEEWASHSRQTNGTHLRDPWDSGTGSSKSNATSASSFDAQSPSTPSLSFMQPLYESKGKASSMRAPSREAGIAMLDTTFFNGDFLNDNDSDNGLDAAWGSGFSQTAWIEGLQAGSGQHEMDRLTMNSSQCTYAGLAYDIPHQNRSASQMSGVMTGKSSKLGTIADDLPEISETNITSAQRPLSVDEESRYSCTSYTTNKSLKTTPQKAMPPLPVSGSDNSPRPLHSTTSRPGSPNGVASKEPLNTKPGNAMERPTSVSSLLDQYIDNPPQAMAPSVASDIGIAAEGSPELTVSFDELQRAQAQNQCITNSEKIKYFRSSLLVPQVAMLAETNSHRSSMVPPPLPAKDRPVDNPSAQALCASQTPCADPETNTDVRLDSNLRSVSLSMPGICRACLKSLGPSIVRSVDGMLSGAYHRACFHCTDCDRPLLGETFYVFEDAPFCARHYHERSNTLCAACDKGIEGLYRRTSDQKNYHLDCLSCRYQDAEGICGMRLETYYQLDRLFYCDEHALKISAAMG